MFEEVHIEEVLLEFIRLMNENTKQYIAGSRRYGFLQLKIGRTVVERYNGSIPGRRSRSGLIDIPNRYLIAKPVPYFPNLDTGVMENTIFEPEGDYWEINGPDFLIEAVVNPRFETREEILPVPEHFTGPTFRSIYSYALMDYYLIGEESAVKKEFAFIKLCHVDD